jgi:hypothetical protein
MGTDNMEIIKIHTYLEYAMIGIFLYLLFSLVVPVLPAFYYPGIHVQGETAFLVVIIALSVSLYVNSIAIQRLKAKKRSSVKTN